jgi:hypothetical protein
VTQTMPAAMGDDLKHLTVRYTPRENSNSATGSAAIAGGADTRSTRPNNTAASEARSRGAPMNASQGRTRGTRLVQQIAQHEVVYDRHEAL